MTALIIAPVTNQFFLGFEKKIAAVCEIKFINLQYKTLQLFNKHKFKNKN